MLYAPHSLTHCAFGDASKLHGVKAQLGPSKHYVNHRQPWLYGTQGPRRRYTERRTVGKVTQRPWIQRTRQMHHCKSECRARLTREATSTSTRTQNCQLLAQNSVTVPTAALTQLRGLSSPPATPARAAPELLEGVGQTCARRHLLPGHAATRSRTLVALVSQPPASEPCFGRRSSRADSRGPSGKESKDP